MEDISKSWKQGVFLELQTPEGAMENPMWVSVRNKVILTKQINMATVFENMNAAISYMANLPEDIVSEGYLIVPMVRTYNKSLHGAFWEHLQRAKEDTQDYAVYLTQAEQQLEQLQKTLLNGPKDLAKSMVRELHTIILDLAIAVDRHLNTKQGE